MIKWIARALTSSSQSENEYGHTSTTHNSEIVKSKGEKYIADYFFSQNIRYQYEREARSHGIIFSKHISNPDFYLPDHDVYVEYWGLVNADKKKVKDNYVRTMKWKMKQYHKARIKFVSIYPKNLNNLDWVFRKKFSKVMEYRLP
jgi:hypothetical protein